MRHLFLSLCLVALSLTAQPIVSPAQAAELPKCRNVAGYEPKAVCAARNQRAQWQAEYTAKVTAQLMADVIAEQAAAAKANETSFMDTVNGIVKGFVDTIQGFF